MDLQAEHPDEEIKDLRRCLNDLVSVLALPAMWSGREPSHVVHTLLDSLLGMLHLDFVYARVNVAAGEAEAHRVFGELYGSAVETRIARGRVFADFDGTPGSPASALWARVPSHLEPAAATLALLN